MFVHNFEKKNLSKMFAKVLRTFPVSWGVDEVQSDFLIKIIDLLNVKFGIVLELTSF